MFGKQAGKHTRIRHETNKKRRASFPFCLMIAMTKFFGRLLPLLVHSLTNNKLHARIGSVNDK